MPVESEISDLNSQLPDPRQRYKMTVAYDGTAFHGWQKQHQPPAPESDETDPVILRTVAGVVEGTLQRALGQPINLVGASRTDTGVHAMGQVAHFNADSKIPDQRMAQAINSRLPDDIEVIDVQPIHAEFDAIRDCVSKQYRYSIFNTDRRPLTLRHSVYHFWKSLDIDRMNAAAARIVGEHNFEGFSAAGHGRSSTIRTVLNCRVESDEPQVYIVVEGTGFLYNMVRIITGTLIEVGRGHFEPDAIDQILQTADRRHAGPTAPPQGLCLEWIKYK